jgi:hypothetical protein
MPPNATPIAAKQFLDIAGQRMAFIDEGEGDAIVFQHGNPTSSYLWRNVMPHCRGLGRLIACDLLGMGDSDKLPDSGPDRYRFDEHSRYLDALWSALAWATGWCWCCTTGDRRWASTGPTGIATGSRVSPTWRASSRRSPGRTGRTTRAAYSRTSAPRVAKPWCWRRTCSSTVCCTVLSCGR